jgi:hypothetical protein
MTYSHSSYRKYNNAHLMARQRRGVWTAVLADDKPFGGSNIYILV